MNMYVWDSKAFGNWGEGTIAVIAPTVGVAKSLVWAAFSDWCKEYKDFWYHQGELDEMFKGDYQSLYNKLTADLAKEPRIETVLLIPGSN